VFAQSFQALCFGPPSIPGSHPPSLFMLLFCPSRSPWSEFCPATIIAQGWRSTPSSLGWPGVYDIGFFDIALDPRPYDPFLLSFPRPPFTSAGVGFFDSVFFKHAPLSPCPFLRFPHWRLSALRGFQTSFHASLLHAFGVLRWFDHEVFPLPPRVFPLSSIWPLGLTLVA